MYSIPTLEIYIDILFILNFIMDYFIFWMVSKVIHQKVPKIRLSIGASIGALLYCLVIIIPFLRGISIWIYLIMLPVLPIIIVFAPSTIKEFIQLFFIVHVTALVVGGVGFGMFYSVKEGKVLEHIYKKDMSKFSIWILLSSIIISYIAVQVVLYYMKKRNIGIQKLYCLQIICNKQEVFMDALLDTGNKVYDPITKHPVIIVEYAMIESLIPETIRTIYSNKKDDITLLVQEASKCDFGRRIRVIPYHSLGNPNGILLGFKPDQVCIQYDDMPWKVLGDVVIAIYNYTLSGEGRYHALIHADFTNQI